jgi:hypothetical protein
MTRELLPDTHRTIESVFEKLVDWAAAALEKSSNQPVLPHAIIVLNASENSTQPDLWDIDVNLRLAEGFWLCTESG